MGCGKSDIRIILSSSQKMEKPLQQSTWSNGNKKKYRNTKWKNKKKTTNGRTWTNQQMDNNKKKEGAIWNIRMELERKHKRISGKSNINEMVS